MTSRRAHLERLLVVTSKKPFETVVAEHWVTVIRVCRALLDPASADDACSETFVSAMIAYPSLASDANVKAWLITIAHRKSIDISRMVARQPIPIDQIPDTAAPTITEALTEPHDPALIAAVQRLPEKQRHAVIYHYLADLPYIEVADILGGSVDAARRAAADGIASLRRHYPAAGGREESRNER